MKPYYINYIGILMNTLATFACTMFFEQCWNKGNLGASALELILIIANLGCIVFNFKLIAHQKQQAKNQNKP